MGLENIKSLLKNGEWIYSKEQLKNINSNEKISIITFRHEAYQRKIDEDFKFPEGMHAAHIDGLEEQVAQTSGETALLLIHS